MPDVQRFRKKPVVVEAIEWTGDNFDEVKKFVGDCALHTELTTIVVLPYFTGGLNTLPEGSRVVAGEWIVKDVMGEFYPCSKDIFDALYEPEA
ncbi:hypothetical protein ES703_67471 [subsurface metagenome]